MTIDNFKYQFENNIEEEDFIYGKIPKQKAENYLKNLEITKEDTNNKELLIAGVGAGKELKYLNDFGWKITAIDLFIDKARQENVKLDINLIQTDIIKFNPINRYDYIYSVGVLHHTPEPRKYFNHLVKLLKPQGKIYIWIYNKQRFGFLRRFKTYNWKKEHLLNFSKLFALFIYPFYRLIKGKKRSFRSITLHIFDCLCCEYQFIINKSEIINWFKINGMVCFNNGEGYLGIKSKKEM